jgi:hypothetical protein
MVSRESLKRAQKLGSWAFSWQTIENANERPLRIPIHFRHNVSFWAIFGNQSKDRQKGKRGCARFPQNGILVDASMGLEIDGNRTPRGIWIFLVYVSNALGAFYFFGSRCFSQNYLSG